MRRVDFGYFVRPPQETGTGQPRVDPALGYLVGHPRGMILFDTGMGAHPDVDAYYRIHRIGLADALAAAGARIGDLSLAANCHLHFDHCGGNPLLGTVPVFVQRAELAAARQTENYTLPELLDGCRFEQVTGEAELLPGVYLLPTPGHTGGHQSLVVRRPDGVVIVAGSWAVTGFAYGVPGAGRAVVGGALVRCRCGAAGRRVDGGGHAAARFLRPGDPDHQCPCGARCH